MQDRQAGALTDAISRDTAALDAAVDLLFQYDPECHHPRDFVMSIAQTILGRRLVLHDARTWTDEGEHFVGTRG